MHYNGPIVRPQTDADSIFIEVTVGCTHNQCSFCNFYEGYPFSVASMQQIEEDLIEASRRYPAAKKSGPTEAIHMRSAQKDWPQSAG